jgi:type IV pilus assembly protein PilE
LNHPIRFSDAKRLGNAGFTLIELLVVIAIVAILTTIAVPSYQSYVKKSRARTAAADLTALSMTVENRYQKTLSYPTGTSENIVAASPKPDWAAAWSPAVADYYTYLADFEDSNFQYELKAVGKNGTSCTITLRVGKYSTGGTITRSASGSDCGFTSW